MLNQSANPIASTPADQGQASDQRADRQEGKEDSMRTVVCHFQDEVELREHLIYGPNTSLPPRALTFLGDFRARPGEEIQVVVLCDSHAEQCVIHVVVGPGLPHNDLPLWQYIGKIKDTDRVWLQMLIDKVQTMSRFQFAS